MNKKSTRKLTLNRETVRHLQEEDLRGAAGGTSNWNSCDTITYNACPSEVRCPTTGCQPTLTGC